MDIPLIISKRIHTERMSNMGNGDTFSKIYEVVKQIPYGKVATYGQIASLAGNVHLARVVGYALHANPDPVHIPCFRVVNIKGEISKAFAFGGENRQRMLLKGEGVPFLDDNTVDLSVCRWEKISF